MNVNGNVFSMDVVGTFSTELGMHILSFVTTIVIVRNLSTADFGIFSLLISFSLTLCYFSTLGLPQAVVYFIGKRKEPLEKIVSLSLFLFLCIAISIATIGYAFKGYPLNSFLKELPGHYFLPLLILFFFTLLDSYLLSIIRGIQNFLLFNIRRLLTSVGNLLGICFLLLFFGLSLGSVVTVFICISVAFTVWFFFKVISITSFRLYLNWATVKSFFTYGIKSYLQILAGHLIYQIDLYIIAYLLGAKQIAFYSIAVGIATLLWYLPNTVGVVLFPALSSEDNEKDIHIFSALVCRHTLVTTSLGAICLALIGKYLILLFYGAQYIRSVNAMLLILPGVVAMSIYKILTRNFSSRNRQQVSIMAATISLIVNICLNFAWIPKYGIEGAALASTVSYIFAGAILVFKVKLDSDMPLRKLLVVNASDIRSYVEAISRFQKRYLTFGH
jgi:O-antigen/teichoic acid export membrane protein